MPAVQTAEPEHFLLSEPKRPWDRASAHYTIKNKSKHIPRTCMCLPALVAFQTIKNIPLRHVSEHKSEHIPLDTFPEQIKHKHTPTIRSRIKCALMTLTHTHDLKTQTYLEQRAFKSRRSRHTPSMQQSNPLRMPLPQDTKRNSRRCRKTPWLGRLYTDVENLPKARRALGTPTHWGNEWV